MRHQAIRCSADGVFSTIFIRFSGEWSAAHNVWVLQLCKLAFSCGTTVHLDISAWDNCWYDPLFIHCVATGFRHVVQIPPCAFQGKAGRPWIMVSSSEAFASLGEVCTCKRCLRCSGDIPYTASLIEAFGKLFISTDGATSIPGATFSVQDAWDSILAKSVDEPPHAWVDGGGLHSRPDWSGKERIGKDVMRELRHSLMEFCGQSHFPSRLRSRLLSPQEESLFSAEDSPFLATGCSSKQDTRLTGPFLQTNHTASMHSRRFLQLYMIAMSHCLVHCFRVSRRVSNRTFHCQGVLPHLAVLWRKIPCPLLWKIGRVLRLIHSFLRSWYRLRSTVVGFVALIHWRPSSAPRLP